LVLAIAKSFFKVLVRHNGAGTTLIPNLINSNDESIRVFVKDSENFETATFSVQGERRVDTFTEIQRLLEPCERIYEAVTVGAQSFMKKLYRNSYPDKPPLRSAIEFFLNELRKHRLYVKHHPLILITMEVTEMLLRDWRLSQVLNILSRDVIKLICDMALPGFALTSSIPEDVENYGN
jgi:hypothetical protein